MEITAMPLLRINAGSDGPELHGSGHALLPALRRHVAKDGDGPVIVMTHGYRFRPGDGDNCPHTHILALDDDMPCPRAVSWPRLLGVTSSQGLGIAFGWHARGTLWQARQAALRAGGALAVLVRRLRRLAPHRPVHVIAHSLGAQVALSALAQGAPGDLSRLVVLNGAAYQGEARAALASPAGRRAELFNVTAPENAFYDFLFERLVRPAESSDRALGRGFHAENAVTLRLGDPGLLRHLAPHGVRIGDAARPLCHWSTYLRPGVFDLYRDLMHHPERLSLVALRRMTDPAGVCDHPAAPDRPRVLMPPAKSASWSG